MPVPAGPRRPPRRLAGAVAAPPPPGAVLLKAALAARSWLRSAGAPGGKRLEGFLEV